MSPTLRGYQAACVEQIRDVFRGGVQLANRHLDVVELNPGAAPPGAAPVQPQESSTRKTSCVDESSEPFRWTVSYECFDVGSSRWCSAYVAGECWSLPRPLSARVAANCADRARQSLPRPMCLRKQVFQAVA